MHHILLTTASLYDRLTTRHRLIIYEKIIVGLAILLFLAHLLSIFLSRANLIFLPFIDPSSFLAAIQTPFTVILYYEVFLLIFALAKPLLISIGKQFEIATLLIIRDVFKYLSQIETGVESLSVLPMIGVSLVASVVVFALLGIFYYLVHQKQTLFISDTNPAFIIIKKIVSLIFCVYLLAVGAGESLMAFNSFLTLTLTGTFPALQIEFSHYREVLTAMIFTDVCIFILSLLYLSAYRHVFIESSLIIATILIRLSFTFSYPINIAINTSAILFGVLMVYVYSYYAHHSLGSEED